MANIQYLASNQIDKQQWDRCMEKASNSLIYGFSYYLDAMTDNWDALVLNNYEAVMPLPWRKKWGVYYLYQPAFVAQLGLFGNNISSNLLLHFFQAIPKKFQYWDLSLNHQNLFALEQYPLHQRSNFVLALNKPYEVLYGQYRENIKRNIKKAENYGCSINTSLKPLLNWLNSIRSKRNRPSEEKDFENFKASLLLKRGFKSGELWSVLKTRPAY